MRSTELRTGLLPRSGVGVVAPWLIVAPKDNPIIRLDLRLLDRIRIRTEADMDDESDDSELATDERKAYQRCELLLLCGDLEVALYIADGPEAVERIVREAAPLIRKDGGGTPIELVEIAPTIEEPNLPIAQGKLVVVSSTADAEITSTDELAGKVYDLTAPQVTIGRADDNVVIIKHRSISLQHAKVTRDPETGRYTIDDLQSTNGVRVNGEERGTVELNDGDLVDVGHVRLRFESGEDVLIPSGTPNVARFLLVGRDRVFQRGEFLHVGQIAFRLNEVKEYAELGANLPLPDNHLLQAAMAMLVVAAGYRDQAPPVTAD